MRSGSQEVCDYKLPSVLQTKPCRAGGVVFQCYYLVYFSVCVSLCFSSVVINVINAIIPETSCTLLILAVQMLLNEQAPNRIALIFVNKGQFNRLSSLRQPKMACSAAVMFLQQILTVITLICSVRISRYVTNCLHGVSSLTLTTSDFVAWHFPF